MTEQEQADLKVIITRLDVNLTHLTGKFNAELPKLELLVNNIVKKLDDQYTQKVEFLANQKSVDDKIGELKIASAINSGKIRDLEDARLKLYTIVGFVAAIASFVVNTISK